MEFIGACFNKAWLKDKGMCLPVLHRCVVLGDVDRDAASAVFRSQGIAHDRDWIHGRFVILDGEDVRGLGGLGSPPFGL